MVRWGPDRCADKKLAFHILGKAKSRIFSKVHFGGCSGVDGPMRIEIFWESGIDIPVYSVIWNWRLQTETTWKSQLFGNDGFQCLHFCCCVMFSATVITALNLCQWLDKPCKCMKKFSFQKPGDGRGRSWEKWSRALRYTTSSSELKDGGVFMICNIKNELYNLFKASYNFTT